mgnify:CR=1 FL=1
MIALSEGYHAHGGVYCPRRSNTTNTPNCATLVIYRGYGSWGYPASRLLLDRRELGRANKYVLGDVFFCDFEKAMRIMGRLMGKIHLVYGNHDQVIQKNGRLVEKFESVAHYRKLRIGKQVVILHHYPYLEWEQCHRGAYALFGHVHGSMDRNPHVLRYRTMDVGVDSRPGGVAPQDGAMTLWNWDQVDSILKQREILTHH